MTPQPTRRRFGCVDCRLIEPEPGTWIEGRCPRCLPYAPKVTAPQPEKKRNRYPRDLTGLGFGRLNVVGFAFKRKGKRKERDYWNCRCECGTVKVIEGDSIRRGMTRSCGCLAREASPLIDLVGRTFGRLTVTGRAPTRTSSSGRRYVYWNCQCTCGNTTVVLGNNLKAGGVTSCGCFRQELNRKTGLRMSGVQRRNALASGVPANHARGKDNASAKLTPDDVRGIRSAFASGVPQARLAEQYGVSPVNIRYVVQFRTWRHIQ